MTAGTAYLSAIYVVAASAIGSFVACMIDRRSSECPPAAARSRCSACLSELRWFEILPILSYAIQSGRCRSCAEPIPLHLLAIEVSFVVATAIAAFTSPPESLLLSVVFTWVLLALSTFDVRLGRLPHPLTSALALSGLVAATMRSGFSLSAALTGLVFGAAISAFVAEAYKRISGRDGLGGGDIRMIAATGAWIGWEGLPSAMFVASAVAIIFLVLTTRASLSTQVAFGPFIALGSFLVWTWQIALK